MAKIVNLRIARKRAARSKAESQAVEQRIVHGTPKRERDRASVERDRASNALERHRIETGDRR
jgi:hypothetical protein